MDKSPLELQLRDLEKFEKKFALLKRVSGTLSVLALVIFLWIQAPHIDFSIPLAGTTASNLNVGYAIVFGPAIITFFLTWQYMIRRKLEIFLEYFDYKGMHEDIASLAYTSLLINNFRKYNDKPFFDYYWLSNHFFRKFFVFLFPALIAIPCFIKLIELVPMKIDKIEVIDWIPEEKSKNKGRYNCLVKYKSNPDLYPCNWETLQKAGFWLFHDNWSGTPATLMNKAIERDEKKGKSFPHIYTYTVWINLSLIFVIFWLSHQCNHLSNKLIVLHNKKLVDNKCHEDEIIATGDNTQSKSDT